MIPKYKPLRRLEDEDDLVEEFDSWLDELALEDRKIVNVHLKRLMTIKNMGEISAKLLLARLYPFVLLNQCRGAK